MQRHLRRRLRSPDGDPTPLGWSIALISLILPVAGLFLCLLGALELSEGDASGWAWIGGGITVIAFDIVIDVACAHPSIFESDQPDLNRRTHQFAGRRAIVVEPIVDGRGKIRMGDTVWPAQGPDSPAGAVVRIAAAEATLLTVEPDPCSPA